MKKATLLFDITLITIILYLFCCYAEILQHKTNEEYSKYNIITNSIAYFEEINGGN